MAFLFQLTNTAYGNALPGQDAIVTVSQSQKSYLQSLQIGWEAIVGSSGVYGYISQVDIYGYTFKVKPVTPTQNMASASTGGLLLPNEIITISH